MITVRGTQSSPETPAVTPQFTEEEDEDEDPLEWDTWTREAIELFKTTLSMQIAQHQTREGTGLDLVPKQYHDFSKVFDEVASKRLPQRKPWDHAIDLRPDAQPYAGKAYPIDNKQQEALDAFISDNLSKGYIRPSNSPWTAPFFFVGKKDRKL
jgi:hypothetical protein